MGNYKCSSLFSGKNKKRLTLEPPAAELGKSADKKFNRLKILLPPPLDDVLVVSGKSSSSSSSSSYVFGVYDDEAFVGFSVYE